MAIEPSATVLSLPTILWSGVLAAIVSLAGAVGAVILSNRSSERRLLTQLRHDTSEKQRDRVAVLRKEVYLKLFEDLSAVSGHLGSLAGKDPVTEDLGGPLQSVMAQLGKVQLVGTQQTALLAGDLTSLFGESLFRLLLAAKPIHETKIDIDIADKMYQQHMMEAQRVNREMQAINESGKPDPIRFRALQVSFDHCQQQYHQASEERTAAWEKFNSLQKPFMEAAFEELRLIGPAQAKLMVAMREEIGLVSDLDFMLTRIESTQARMLDATDSLLTELAEDQRGESEQGGLPPERSP